MTQKTLFLAWQDKIDSRQWFPIGRLDERTEAPAYRFRYTYGARRAQKEAGFPLLMDFPDFERDYRASRLFPLFQNRVMNQRRPDREHHLERLGLPLGADPFEILSTSGGYRATDAYEVFPRLAKGRDGSFSCRFFLHGWRYANETARRRLNDLEDGEELYVTLELTNPRARFAVQIQTTDYYMIGWAPRYLVRDLAMAMTENPRDYAARVVRINPQPAPSKQRVLIEMKGRWDGYEPMTGNDYQPVVDD